MVVPDILSLVVNNQDIYNMYDIFGYTSCDLTKRWRQMISNVYRQNDKHLMIIREKEDIDAMYEICRRYVDNDRSNRQAKELANRICTIYEERGRIGDNGEWIPDDRIMTREDIERERVEKEKEELMSRAESGDAWDTGSGNDGIWSTE